MELKIEVFFKIQKMLIRIKKYLNTFREKKRKRKKFKRTYKSAFLNPQNNLPQSPISVGEIPKIARRNPPDRLAKLPKTAVASI